MPRLTLSDRRKLAKMYAAEESTQKIAKALGCHLSTIYNELRRGYTGEFDANMRPQYDPVAAQKIVQTRVRRCGRRPRSTT